MTWSHSLALAIELAAGEARRGRVPLEVARRGIAAQMKRLARRELAAVAEVA